MESGRIPTASGSIRPDELGFTLPHEHIFLLSPGLRTNWPHLVDTQMEVERAVSMLAAGHRAGVRTVFDLTTIDLGRDASLMAQVAERTEVNLVLATGLHLRPPGVVNRRVSDGIVDLFTRDLTLGIAESGVRAGVIKIASGDEVTPQNEVHLRAAARAHVATGAPILTHSDADAHTGMRQLELFEAEGVNLSQVVIGHVGDTTDLTYLEQLAQRGVKLGMDRFGTGLGANDDDRTAIVVELCRRGYSKQLMLSHDTSCFSDTLPWKVREQRLPSWNFELIPRTIIPALRSAGVSESQIHQMTTTNVQDLFVAADRGAA